MKYDLIQTSERDTVPAFDPTTFWTEFRHGTATVNGVRLHFVAGGNGESVLLLPGWPQSWYAWRYVMPLLLAAGRQVIALDPRGMGDSDRPASGYDLRTVTSDVHGFAGALGLTSKGPVDVVGHDVGTWIGYAYAAEWPDHVKRLAVFGAATPHGNRLLAFDFHKNLSPRFVCSWEHVMKLNSSETTDHFLKRG